MNARTIGYWATTGLAAAGFLMSGTMNLVRPPQLVEDMAHLGYPAYLMLVLGTWKILGAAAIVAPKLPRLKEWAYAGMVFDLSGAALSHGASGDPGGKIVTPLVILGLVVASWMLRPESRKLADAASGSTVPARSPAVV